MLAPDRVQGLLLEMPVLDNAVEAGIIAFAPLLFLWGFSPDRLDQEARAFVTEVWGGDAPQARHA